jgi:hypothetical protein
MASNQVADLLNLTSVHVGMINPNQYVEFTTSAGQHIPLKPKISFNRFNFNFLYFVAYTRDSDGVN